MKRCCTLILLIITITWATINEIKASKRNAKPIQLKGKQIPFSQLQARSNQTAKLPNAKRWMPAKKTNVKYVPKFANNTKRWMPGFAQMGQDDMESSMMYDAGYVSSDPESSFSQPQQQPAGEFGLQQQPQQQGIGPEQSFLTPGSSDPGMNIPGGGTQFQGIGNEIESFTKDGLDDSTGGNLMYNTYDFQDTTLNNPKFQEGDYVGVPLQENTNKPNSYDEFAIEPGMAENFVNPVKNKDGNSEAEGSEEGKGTKQQNKETKNEGTAKLDKEKKLNLKQKSKETVKASKNANLDEKVEEQQGKDSKAKDYSGNEKEVEKSKEDNEKEANDVTETMESTKETKGKEKQKKEQNFEDEKEGKGKDQDENVKKINKNDKESEDVKELDTSKNKGAGENSQQESGKSAKLVTNVEKNEDKEESQSKEKEVDAEKEEEKEKANKKEEEKDQDSKVNEEKSVRINKKLKNLASGKPKKVMKNEEENESESAKGGDYEDADDKKVENTNQNINHHTKNSQAMNKLEKNSSEQKEQESKTAEEVDNAEEDDENREAESRINKLKQRIKAQKMTKNRGRLQQDAAARYKISSDDSDNTPVNNALASNVAPGNAALSMAAEGLRKQLVSNLRNALMKNFATAIAKGNHPNAVGSAGGVTPSSESSQTLNSQAEQQGSQVQGSSEQDKYHDSKAQYSNEQNSADGLKTNDESKMKENSNENQSESIKGKDNSQQSLVPTLMKMDKTMLVDTILKLLKNKKEENKDGEKQSVGEDKKKEKEDKEEDQSAGALNQSFHSNRKGANEGENLQQENPETKENDAKQESGEEQQGNEKSDETSRDSKNDSNENEPGTHAEYSMYPVKAEGSTKYYKLKKLAGQGHIKGKLAKAPGNFDPYAQIGLADPGNNDKITAHHKSSNLKEDFDQQEKQDTKSASSESESNQEESNLEPSNQEDNSKMSATNEQSTQNTDQDSDQQSSESQLLNSNQEQKVASYQQSADQPSNQIANQELTKIQKTEKDSPIQQSTVTVQDGVTTETNINADSPQMVAQLMRISQRLHATNDKKPTQNDEKETGNSKSFANNMKLPDAHQKLHDDAYSTIGSFDPNVKKKAAIGKKKLLINKQILQNDVISKRGSTSPN